MLSLVSIPVTYYYRFVKKVLLALLFFYSQFIFSQCLNGNYSIPGSYSTIPDAIEAMRAWGICGPVTFNIQPGTYTGPLKFIQVPGGSATNTVTFQSATLDSNSVIINSESSPVIKLQGATYFKFRALTIESNSLRSDANVITLETAANNNEISNCVIKSHTPYTDNVIKQSLIINPGQDSRYYTFKNNVFTGGSVGLNMDSRNVTTSSILIQGNTFQEQYKSAIYIFRTTDVVMKDNKVAYGLPVFAGFDLYDCTGNCSISNNEIKLQKGGIGINAYSIQGTSSSSPLLVFNNKISGDSAFKGIVFNYPKYVEVYHNTIVCGNNTVSSHCISSVNTISLTIKNNICYQKGNGVVFDLISPVVSDYNAVYSGAGFGAYNAVNAITFEDWKKQSKNDLHSVNAIPKFVSASDFHIQADFSKNLTLPYFSTVPKDFDGVVRDVNSPYFGAHEFFNDPNLPEAKAVSVIPPVNQICQGTQTFKISFINLSFAALTSATVNWTVNGVVQTPFNWTGNLAYNDTIAITPGSIPFADLASYKVKAWVSNLNNTGKPSVHDTISNSFSTSLSGIYTVGGNSPKFVDLTTALTALHARGLCGPIVFKLRAGVYKESFSLLAVKGLSSTNTFTLTSEDENPSSVTIYSLSNKAALKLEHVSFVFVRNITFGDAAILTQAPLIQYTEGSHHVEIKNCSFFAGDQTVVKTVPSIANTFDYPSDIRILHNTFNSGSNNFLLDAGRNVHIEDNVFKNATGGYTYFESIDSLYYLNNIFTGAGGAVTELFVCRNITAKGNKFYNSKSDVLKIKNCTAGLFANNMIVATSSPSLSNVVLLKASGGINFINNSINSVNSNEYAIVVKMEDMSSPFFTNTNKFWNNIIVNKGLGYTINSLPQQMSLRNNAYYTNGNFFARLYDKDVRTLDEWKTLFVGDTGSVFVDPNYFGEKDLHTRNFLLNNAGTNVSAMIQDDYDHETRTASMPDIGADEFSPYTLDAAVFMKQTTPCVGINAVFLDLKNEGLTPLTTADLTVQLNSSPLNYHWTGNLAPGATETVNIGNYNFINGTSYQLKGWSSNPNNAADQYTNNDTFSFKLDFLGLQGSYTIGGASPDFATINAAVNTMKNGGVCGPVIFNLRNGTYTEQVTVPLIKGASAVNTITFQSEQQDSSLVTIQANPSSYSAVVTVERADYITFNKLGFTIMNDSSGVSILKFKNAAKYSQVRNCLVYAPPSNLGTILISFESNSDSSLVSNSNLLNGQFGIFATGFYQHILNNTIKSKISNNGIYLSEGDFVLASNTVSPGISIFKASGLITKNKITGGVVGLTISYVDSAKTPTIISNNFITGTQSSLFIGTSKNIQVLQNSLYSTTPYGYCFDLYNSKNVLVKNNIFYESDSTKSCIHYTYDVKDYVSDYNCFYSPTKQLITNDNGTFTSLADYFITSPNERHSIVANPYYVSSTDLHINEYELNGKGIFIPEVGDDIDGQARNTSAPDIGADEFTPKANDAGLLGFTNVNACMGNANGVRLKLRNNGVNALTTATINWKVNGIQQPAYQYNGNLITGDTTTITIGSYTFISSQQYTLSAWIGATNGVNDEYHFNDTTNAITIDIPLYSGTYTIGGNSPDFPTISAAAKMINEHGICGPVTFKLRPGTYAEEVTFTICKGASKVNRVLFESESADSTAVTWSSLNVGSSNAPLELDGASYLTFRKITFKNRSAATSVCISLKNASANNEIRNCLFVSQQLITDKNSGPQLNIKGGGNNYNSVENNNFSNAFQGISIDPTLSGSPSSSDKGNIIKRNFFSGFINASIYTYHQQNMKVIDNKIISATFTPDTAGISLDLRQLGDSLLVSGNEVYAQCGKGAAVIEEASSTVVTVKNNYFYFTNGTSNLNLKAVDFLTSVGSQTFFIYNTIRNSTSNAIGLNIRNNADLDVFNNNIVSYSNRLAVSIDTLYTDLPCFTKGNSNFNDPVRPQHYSSDYNNFYNLAPPLIRYAVDYATLTAYQSAAKKDNHSFNADPHFSTAISYRINDASLNNNALTYPDIFDDIQHQPRSTTKPDIGCYEYSPVAVDAAIILHKESINCNGNNPVMTRLINYGNSPLTTVKIGWKVNGVSQTDYVFNGSIAPLDTSAAITIGSVTSTGNDHVSLFISAANGILDTNPANDSVSSNRLAGSLNGLYTIGIKGDFKSFTQVKTQLEKEGVCGPVVFKVLPGTYNERLVFTNVKGSSAINTITFEANDHDASSVVIKSVTNQTDANAHQLFKLDDASYFHFRNLSFKTLASGAYASDHMIVANHSDNLVIDSCIFTGLAAPVSITGYDTKLDLMDCDSIRITNNVFNGRGLGLSLKGNSFVLRGKYAVVSKNRFTDVGFSIENTNDVTIKNNSVKGLATAISLSSIKALAIEQNQFSGKNLLIDLVLVGSKGTLNSKVINNFIYGCLRIHNSGYLNLISNNVLLDSASSPAFITPIVMEDDTAFTIVNNIFANTRPATTNEGVFWLPEGNVSDICNYNDYYCPNAKGIIKTYHFPLSTGYVTLAQWQAFSKLDSNSVLVDPLFVSSSDLHASNALLAELGKAGTGITVDIDNKIRGTIPTIGANELTPLAGTVWPGDSNNDLTADNFDLLPIGLYYGQTGFERLNIRNDWKAYPSNDWNKIQSNGANLKHADCNGDGKIDSNDTLAIHLNFSFVHAFASIPDENFAGNPVLKFETDKSSYIAGEWINVNVMMGTPQLPVSNLYGIAFNIKYNSTLVESNTENLSYPESWFAKPGNGSLSVSNVQASQNKAFAALTRIDHSTKNGYGTIATLRFRARKTVAAVSDMTFSFEGYLAVDSIGQSIPFSIENYTIQIKPLITTIDEVVTSDELTMYPNPYSTFTKLSFTVKEKSEVLLEVFDIAGKKVQTVVDASQQSGSYTYSFSAKANGLDSGVYFVKLKIGNKISVHKIVELD